MDKSLLKVSGIISIVVGILYCITIVGIIVGIPLIIGGSKLKEISELSDEEVIARKDTIMIWTIVFFIFNQISAIISLVFYINMDEIITNKNNNKNTRSSSSDKDKYDSLEKLKKLYDDKAITKEEYEKEKAKILE